MARLRDALEARTGLGALLRRFGARSLPGARVANSTGALVVMAFLIQVVTGLALATTYSPATTTAWGSVWAIEHQMLLGSVVRGVHHWGSSAIIILALVHMTQTLLYGAYRAPRDINWILGVLMLLVVLGLGLTGYMLPWDQKGYWATRVATGIISETPGGDALRELMIGGSELTTASLTRLYGLHAMLLPGVLGLLTVVHVALHLRHGTKARPRKAAAPAPPTVTFWPYQAVRIAVMSGLLLGALLAIGILVGVGLEAPADPSSAYQARPEWYFMGLFELLKLFDGPLVLIGTFVLPTLAIVFLFAVPALDRARDDRADANRGPAKRVLIPYVALIVGAVGLTAAALIKDANDETYQKSRVEVREASERASELAALGGIDPSGRIVFFEAQRLYREKGCADCHDGTTHPSPGLLGFGTEERLRAFLKAPDDPRFFGGTALAGKMEPVRAEGEKLDALVAYLRSLGNPSDASAEVLKQGRKVFRGQCTDCHNLPGKSLFDADAYDLRIAGPDLAGYGSFEWVRALVRDANHPTYFGAAMSAEQRDQAMPPYPDLTDDELSLLTRWLLAGAPGAKR
ncbi:MAG: hypothetical protein EP329_12410 [Deltaproteobacteria bacterium]|nr:MAG: hypothetical protein EP329_12410 [Deltaproteobacteria bacterium]